jgi:hypothetical protein
LRHAVDDYFLERVRTSRAPDFLSPRLNHDSIVNPPGEAPRVNKKVMLARYLDLNGLWNVYDWAKKTYGEPAFTGLPMEDPAELQRWLDVNLLGQPTPSQETFIDAILNAMNHHRKIAPWQPTWVTTWSKLKPHVSAGAARWLEVLGVNRTPFPRWIILMAYSVGDAGTLVRPTQLDAGWYGAHFPSPPQAALRVGGHPMDLQPPPNPEEPRPEYIHVQTDHSVQHWRNADNAIASTTRPTTDGLTHQRTIHHSMLATYYGRDILRWMPQCV